MSTATAPPTRKPPAAGCEVGALFDDLVGQGEQGWWRGEAELLGGSQVDHQLECCWLLDRQIARLLAAQNAVDVTGRLPVCVDEVGSIGHQAAEVGVETPRIDGGQAVLRSKGDDQLTIGPGDAARQRNQAAVRARRKFADGPLDRRGILNFGLAHLNAERSRRALGDAAPGTRVVDPADQYRDTADLGRDLL